MWCYVNYYSEIKIKHGHTEIRNPGRQCVKHALTFLYLLG